MSHDDEALVDGRWRRGGRDAAWSVMDEASAAAARAFPSWSRTPRAARRDVLNRVATSVEAQLEALADAMTREVSKPITWSRAEVTRLAVTFRLAADLLDGPEREELSLERDACGRDYRCEVERFGIGVVLAIVPYNWPYNLAAHKLAPALAAGDTVVLKPSPLAYRSTMALVRLIEEAGLPPGVLNALGCSPEVSERTVADPRIALVSFTGSEAVGFRVREVAGARPVILELGRDASALVFADADLGFAAQRIATSAFGYAGQVCISAQHARVEASALNAFREALIAETLVDEAVRLGARLLVGGTREGRLVRPTLLEGVPPTAKLAHEEAFAPVLTLSSFTSADEAFALVNGSRFGLQASVFTRTPTVAERAFRDLEVGAVVWNDHPSMRFDVMPYGGVKRSGIGREGLRYAYEAMSTPKVLLGRR